MIKFIKIISYLLVMAVFVRTDPNVFTWGKTFNSKVASKNVELGCSHNGKPSCCALSDDEQTRKEHAEVYSHHAKMKEHQTNHLRRVPIHDHCSITKKYIQSEYEKTHFSAVERIYSIQDEISRQAALVEFIHNDLKDSEKWLERVSYHMKSKTSHLATDITKDDEFYLSKFMMSRTCGKNETVVKSWFEWIEPLTIHGRHPTGLTQCLERVVNKNNSVKLNDLLNTDYVLIQNGQGLGAHHGVQHESVINLNEERHNYLFDAGTSTFDSSLFWFVCAYLQRNIEFNQIYGWEATLLEPNNFWKNVPTKLLPFYHFYNIPVGLGDTEYNDLVNLIDEAAHEEDFVSLKLDIDTPHIEIPIALAVARGGRISTLVDEFFFELHFRCEFLMYCGWGRDIPKEDYGLILDRPHAMELFLDMRRQGIRSHYWP